MDGKNKETIYENDSTVVMSEKVQSLAGSIYQEFERMMQKYDEDVVKTLMPLLVNVLESLDLAYQSNQEQDVELELLREDNEQLITQYEREKVARKQSEQKLIETEDIAESENKELASRLESLESIVRMLELKHKNSLEHASRLEEREAELKKEYNKLHERYSELFKTHVDYMERTKLMMGNSTHSQLNSASERLDMNRSSLHPMMRSSGPVSFGFASLENSAMLDEETICSSNSNTSGSGPPSLQNEFENIASEKIDPAQFAETPPKPEAAIVHSAPKGTTTTKKEERSANNLYQELTFNDDNLESEEAEVTGRYVHPGEFASSVSDNFFGMGKEVENLIMENNELLATKNALNIVKDDLILRVDELTGEIEILREELNAVILSRNKLKEKVHELEDELKKAKEQIKQQSNSENEDEGDVPMAQRKRFTRVEMARVLMERNQYKERFMELQDAVRWSEMMRATRVDTLDKKSKQSIWKFFSNLFSSNDRPPNEHGGPLLRYDPTASNVAPEISEGRLAITQGGESNHMLASNALVLSKDFVAEDSKSSQKAMQRRRDQYRQVRAHVQKEDGRLQAYGWSLPGSKTLQSKQSKHSGGVPVPVPVFCRPLAEASPHMKVWCASGVNLNGGFTKDGGCMVGASVFYSKDESKVEEITSPNEGESADFDALEKHINIAMKSPDEELQLSSYVWICTSNHTVSTVTVIDAKNPAEILDSFPVCQTHLLCICSVIGALEKDYALLENSEVTKSGYALEKPGEGPDNIGQIKYSKVSDITSNDIAKIEVIPVISEEGNSETKSEKTGSPEFNAVVEDVLAPPISPFHLGRRSNNSSQNNSAPNSIPFSNPINPISGATNPLDEPAMSSIGPTMWLGAQNGMLYVHSSVARWRTCLHSVKLPDAVLAIVYIESRVVCALANGCLAVFGRQTSGEWDLSAYHILTLGSPKRSIRCLTVVGDKVWAAHQNKIHVVDPISLNIIHSMEAHPRKESQIRQMAASGLGVWVSIRLDSTLRLYHADTYEHLQDIDIEPYVSKMLGTGKLGFSFVRITALLISCNRLWIGTGNGVIISIPLIDGNASARDTFIPKCCMANAQLSFHGHRDAVKFFASVPMTSLMSDTPLSMPKKPDMLVLSGGEGYIDFRQEEHADDATDVATHLLVWQVSAA